jgi:hypothetical protein
MSLRSSCHLLTASQRGKGHSLTLSTAGWSRAADPLHLCRGGAEGASHGCAFPRRHLLTDRALAVRAAESGGIVR